METTSANVSSGSQRRHDRAAPEGFLRQKHRHRPLRVFSENLRALDELRRIHGVAQNVVANSQSLQYGFGHGSRSAEGAIADISGIRDQQQNWNLILQQRAHDAVTTIKKSAVLHDRRAFFAEIGRA